MTRLVLMISLVMMLMSCAHDPMTKDDWSRQMALMGVTAGDYYYTMDVAKHPARHSYIEHYSLGRHPDPDEVNRHFATFAILHTAITYAMPKEWRNAWQYIWIGIELNQTLGSLDHDHRDTSNRFGVGVQIQY